jgi:anti-sigma-K factor RskA
MTDDPKREDGGMADVAAELALRLLEGPEEAAARQRVATDPAFAAEVEAWEARLGGLVDEVAPVPPPATVWSRIDARLPANDDRRLAFWRAWALGATGLLAASLAAVVVLAVRPAPTPVAPEAPPAEVTRVATLRLESGQSALILAYDPETGMLFASPTDVMAGDPRVPHLWLIGSEGGATLVGPIDGVAVSRMAMPAETAERVRGAVSVAVSMEAPGHTPAMDRPDGPVVASGELERL